MKRILVCGLLAFAVVGLSQSTASAICFDVYRPCVRLPLPRLPIFLPHFCIGCDSEGKQGGCGGKLLFNKSSCASCGGGASACGAGCGYPTGCGNRSPYLCPTPDCNRPMYPNPGYGYNCWNGNVAPWYTYFPPTVQTGYQVGAYGAFRGPAGAGYPPAQAPMQKPAAYAPNYGGGYAQNVPSYWYGR
jgi:hypothetical protein